MRAGNRVVNKGLRLDYFICDPSLFTENSHVIVRDCYMDTTQEGSDHCPVILEMEIKSSTP
jgi:exonuclease III